MNEFFVQLSQNSTALLVAIDYYTIFYFFLQISLDFFESLDIIEVKRGARAAARGGQKPVPSNAPTAFGKV